MFDELPQKFISTAIHVHFEGLSNLLEVIARNGWPRQGVRKFEHLEAGQQFEIRKFCGRHFCSQIAPCHHVSQALNDEEGAGLSLMPPQSDRGMPRNWHQLAFAQVCQSQARVASCQAAASCKEPLKFPFECFDLLDHLLQPEGLPVKKTGQDKALVACIGQHP